MKETKQIKIYWGSDADFESAIQEVKSPCFLFDLLNYINKQEIVLKSSISDENADEPIKIKHLIVHTDDYGSIKEWALLGFSNNILENEKVDIENIWLSNPPQKILEDIKRYYHSGQIEEYFSEYSSINVEIMKQIASGYDREVIDQSHVIIKVLSAIYALNNPIRSRPVTILFLGDSGVGKTETAKYISRCLKEEMVRIQFSMQQTTDASQFIFGAEHGQNSLARELIRRNSNVILLDEFDKVSPFFYNAFYQMFDEGIFVDANYIVDVKKCIIICTTNFHDEYEAEQYLGSAIFSRFSKVIRFKKISIDGRMRIASKVYGEVLAQLTPEDRKILPNDSVLNFFEEQIQKGKYTNIRMLKNDIEDAVYYELLKAHGIIEDDNQ